MRIGDIYHRGVLSVQVTDRVVDAAAQMTREEVGSLAVFDGDRFAGIITERDLVRAVAEGLSPRVTEVAHYMSPDPVVARLDDDSSQVALRMLEQGVRHLPVVEDGAVVGMISARDLLIVEAWPVA